MFVGYDGKASTIHFTMAERSYVGQAATMMGALARIPVLSQQTPLSEARHPHGLGTWRRVLGRYLLDDSVVTREDPAPMMTSQSASGTVCKIAVP